MALIACRECSKQISDKAKDCPHCGAPIARIRTTTIQKTSKPYKFFGLVFGLMLLATPFLVFNNYPIAAAICLILGIGGSIFVRVGVWWSHS